jgi:pimeloyl-ACP methyl ester carboxylesterase
MAFATSPKDGTRIYYEVHGRGFPLILFHGSATSSALWHVLGYVEALRGHRLILIDGRGHGRSDKPRAEPAYRMDMFVADVLAVLDHLGVDRTNFFGYSLGGRLGYALASAEPGRLNALVIGGGSQRPQRGALDRLIYAGFAETIATSGISAFLDTWSDRLGREVDPGLRAVFLGNDPTALVAFLEQTQKETGFSADALGRLELPVLLLVGDHDRERLDDSRVAAAVLPDAELAMIEGADHFTTLLRRDEVVSRLRGFLGRAASCANSAQRC